MLEMRTPLVYVLVRDETLLYIGKGASMARPLSTDHHVMRFTKAGDRLLVYRVPTSDAATLLEGQMIRALRPSLNVNQAGVFSREERIERERNNPEHLRYFRAVARARVDELRREIARQEEYIKRLENLLLDGSPIQGVGAWPQGPQSDTASSFAS